MFTRRSIFIGMAFALCAIPAFGFMLYGGGGKFDLVWHSMDSGGGESSGGVLDLRGTIGQSDAGAEMSGSTFSLTGGFLAPTNVTCPADTDGSGFIDVNDLLALLADWGPCPSCATDVNDDGEVNVNDLLDLLAAWGVCP